MLSLRDKLKKFFFQEIGPVQLPKDGFMVCKHCKEKINLKVYKSPLKISSCHHCKGTFLVPLQVGEDWWIIKPFHMDKSLYIAANKKNRKAVIQYTHEDKDFELGYYKYIKGNPKFLEAVNDCPYLTQVHYHTEEHEGAYHITEFIEGDNLEDILKDKTKISVAKALKYSLHIARGLEVFHHHGLVYRGLTPRSIVICEDEDIAHIVNYRMCLSPADSAIINDHQTEGIPAYMPVERIRGERETFQSDYYTLGLILYHMITGETYFSKNTNDLQLTLQKQQEEDRPIDSDLSSHIRYLLMKLIAFDPKDRIEDDEELESRIKSAIEAEGEED